MYEWSYRVLRVVLRLVSPSSRLETDIKSENELESVRLTGAWWFSAVVVITLHHVQLPALLQLIQGSSKRHLKEMAIKTNKTSPKMTRGGTVCLFV